MLNIVELLCRGICAGPVQRKGKAEQTVAAEVVLLKGFSFTELKVRTFGTREGGMEAPIGPRDVGFVWPLL